MTPTRAFAAERKIRRERTDDILERSATASPRQQEALLGDLVEANMGVARAVAARYRGRGIPLEDLEQVACLALVRVARSFEPDQGHDFLSYAVPSMRGEILRYFRDQGWAVRPPRRVQELQGRLARAEAELSTTLGRPPTPQESAAALDESLDDVTEALTARGCFSPTSLDALEDQGLPTPDGGMQRGTPLLDSAEARVVLAPVLRQLPERDRRIVFLRFFEHRTQREIGEEIGVTQMQVSRLIDNLLARMRRALEERPRRTVAI